MTYEESTSSKQLPNTEGAPSAIGRSIVVWTAGRGGETVNRDGRDGRGGGHLGADAAGDGPGVRRPAAAEDPQVHQRDDEAKQPQLTDESRRVRKGRLKQKAAAVSQIERDRIAREKAEKVRRFIAERDRLRPLAPNYLSAFKATIDLNPITRLDEMTLARQKRERMRLAQLEEKPSKPPPRVRRPILPKSKVVEVGSSSSSEVVAGDVQIIPPWPYRNSPSPAAGSSSSAQRSGDPTTAGRNSPADGPNSPSAGSPAKVRDVKVGVLGVIDETEVQTKLKLRKKLRKKKKELAKKGPTLLSPRQLDGEGMAEKVEAMLQKTIGDGLALLEAPINEKMDAGFDEVARAIKIHEGERRWAEWPFGNRGEKPVARHGSLPPRMKHAPWATDITYHSVALAWDFVKDVGGYECEVADINALEGQQEWRKVYKGPKQECIVRKLGREIEGIRVRVRTFNGIGKSEWSPRSELIKLAPLPAPINREIEEIPGTWLTIDTAGIPELGKGRQRGAPQHGQAGSHQGAAREPHRHQGRLPLLCARRRDQRRRRPVDDDDGAVQQLLCRREDHRQGREHLGLRSRLPPRGAHDPVLRNS